MNTAIVITGLICATALINSAIVAARDVAAAKHRATPQYPHADGDFTILGPEIFTDQSGDVICWKGVNYVRQEAKEATA